MTVTLNDPVNTVFEGTGIYVTSVTDAPDQLMAFDIQGNGNYPSVAVTTLEVNE